MTAGKSLIEVIIFLPIRRSFRQQEPPPSDDDFGGPGGVGSLNLTPDYLRPESVHQRTGGAARFQTFHYHLPPNLRGEVEPGHLVWAPFGPQEVQGIVVGPAISSPVETKAIDRLARPRPVLTPAQLDMAFWIADYYVAPVSEAVKLFLTPGLLSKSGEPPRVRVKMEEQIELLVDPASIRPRLLGLKHSSKQAHGPGRIPGRALTRQGN